VVYLAPGEVGASLGRGANVDDYSRSYQCQFCGKVYVVPSLARWCEQRHLRGAEGASHSYPATHVRGEVNGICPFCPASAALDGRQFGATELTHVDSEDETI